MKLTANIIRDKKGSLEEGPTRCESRNDNSVANRVENNNNCEGCVRFMKVIFYLLFVLFILFIGWIVLVYFALNTASTMCTVNDIPNELSSEDFVRDFEAPFLSGLTTTAMPDDSMTNTDGSEMPPAYGIEHFMESESTTTSIVDEGVDDLDDLGQLWFRALINGPKTEINRNSDLTTKKVELERGVSTETEIPIFGTSEEPNTNDPFYSEFERLNQKTIVPSTTPDDYMDLPDSMEDGPLSDKLYSDEGDAYDYYNWPRNDENIPLPEKRTTPRSIDDVKSENESCTDILDSVDRMIVDLGALIVSGDAFDPIVMEIRRKFKISVKVLFRSIAFQPTENTWRRPGFDSNNDAFALHLLSIIRTNLMSATDRANQQLFQQSEPLTQEMIQQFRSIIQKVLFDHANCLPLLSQEWPVDPIIT